MTLSPLKKDNKLLSISKLGGDFIHVWGCSVHIQSMLYTEDKFLIRKSFTIFAN